MPSGWSPPAAGSAALISTNTVAGVGISGFTAQQVQNATFNAFGAGQMVPAYGTSGAYVICGTGGHSSAMNQGAFIFDLNTGTWSHRTATNAGLPADSTTDYTSAQTTGTPWFEVTAASGNAPAPGHPYFFGVGMPGGTSGLFVRVGGAAVDQTAEIRLGCHQFDLSSGLWSRVSANTYAGSEALDECFNVQDPTTSTKIYLFGRPMHQGPNNSIPYYDTSAGTWSRTSTYSFPSLTGLTSVNFSCFIYKSGVSSYMMIQCGSYFAALDLNNTAGNWNEAVSLTGTFTDEKCDWTWYPEMGNYYRKSTRSGNVIEVLTPPASGNGKTGTWVRSTITITGATLPTWDETGGAGIGMYTWLRYASVGGHGYLFLFSGASNQVAVINLYALPGPAGGTESGSPQSDPTQQGSRIVGLNAAKIVSTFPTPMGKRIFILP